MKYFGYKSDEISILYENRVNIDMEDFMKNQQFLIKIFVLLGIFILSFSFLIPSPTLSLLEENYLHVVPNRTYNTDLFKIKLDDFGQPISYGPLIPDETIPTIVGATSQQQILQNQLEEAREKIENTQDQLEILKIQKNILINESSAFSEFLETSYLIPLQTIQSNILALDSEEVNLVIPTVDNCLLVIEQYLQNPNQSDYETMLMANLEQLSQFIEGKESPRFLHKVLNFFQSDTTQTKLNIQLIKTKNIMDDFQTQIILKTSSEIEDFKKTKRQQLATENAISTKYIELDELILELSGILDEIEEVTQ